VTNQEDTVANGTCSNPDCTVATTGKCLESHETIAECPHFTWPSTDDRPSGSESMSSGSAKGPPPKPSKAAHGEIAPKITRKFYPGSELGLEDAAEIMRSKYSHVIGVLGQTNAGKTAFLSALYLLASQGLLRPEYSFAGSLTLQGFEDRVRRVRRWEKGGLPKEFMAHTQLPNPRSPSFMHLALKEGIGRQRRVELLLTDLPGEWTSDLINLFETAVRFGFLKRADGVVYVLDGPLLAGRNSKYQEAHRANLMLTRLRKAPLVNIDTPLILFISKSDELEMKAPSILSEIVEAARALDFDPKVIMSSCFSRVPARIESGTGVKDAIDYVLAPHEGDSSSKSSVAEKALGERAFGRFRRGTNVRKRYAAEP
jgi:hypothetical protein